MRTLIKYSIPSVVDPMTAAPPPKPFSDGILVGVHNRAHAHRKEAVRLGEVNHVKFDHRVTDRSCPTASVQSDGDKQAQPSVDRETLRTVG